MYAKHEKTVVKEARAKKRALVREMNSEEGENVTMKKIAKDWPLAELASVDRKMAASVGCVLC